MPIVAQKNVTAVNQYCVTAGSETIFQLQGDDAVVGQRSALVQMYGGSGNTVTIRRYAADKTTVIDSMTITKSQELRVPVTGLYDVGVTTFGSGPVLVTVEQ